MRKIIKVVAILTLIAPLTYAKVNLSACAGCHGKDFEKHAMGKSKVVKDLKKEDIIKALKGYKDGSYGGAMKGIMKGQVAKLTEEDIKMVAEKVGK